LRFLLLYSFSFSFFFTLKEKLKNRKKKYYPRKRQYEIKMIWGRKGGLLEMQQAKSIFRKELKFSLQFQEARSEKRALLVSLDWKVSLKNLITGEGL